MKHNVLRRLIGILLCLSMVFSVTVIAFADELDGPVTEDQLEKYQYASNASADISISNSGTATFIANAKSQIGIATKITGTCSLQKYSNGSWIKVKAISGNTNSLSLTLNSMKANLTNGRYRTHAVFKVYCGNKYETVTVSSSSLYYSNN